MISVNYLFENYIFSNTTLAVDLHKFPNQKLFIFGFSGSGKTSFSKKISKQYNQNVCSLDSCWSQFLINGHPKHSNKDYMIEKVNHCFEKMIFKKQCNIVEGINLVQLFYSNKNIQKVILKSPCVFLGKSALKSSYDAAKRNHNLNFLKEIFHITNTNFHHISNNIDKIKKQRINVPNSEIQIINVSNKDKK